MCILKQHLDHVDKPDWDSHFCNDLEEERPRDHVVGLAEVELEQDEILVRFSPPRDHSMKRQNFVKDVPMGQKGGLVFIDDAREENLQPTLEDLCKDLI